MDATRIPYSAYRMLVSLDSDGKCNWMTKLRLLLHETGFGYVSLTQGVGDEQHFIRIFRQRLTDIHFQEWAAGLNASSRFDLYREFKTALNAETYLDCIKQKCFRDCLVRIRLGISNLKVHKNRYARSEELMDNDCPFCPGMQDNDCPFCPGMQDNDCPFCPCMHAGQRTALVLCVQEIREDKTEHAEKY